MPQVGWVGRTFVAAHGARLGESLAVPVQFERHRFLRSGGSSSVISKGKTVGRLSTGRARRRDLRCLHPIFAQYLLILPRLKPDLLRAQ